jgi:hypothetical protein
MSDASEQQSEQQHRRMVDAERQLKKLPGRREKFTSQRSAIKSIFFRLQSDARQRFCLCAS